MTPHHRWLRRLTVPETHPIAIILEGKKTYTFYGGGDQFVDPGDYLFRVTATFQGAGKISATLRYSTTVPCPPPAQPPPTPASTPAIDVQPLTLDFGDVEITKTKPMTALISNTGKASLSVSSIASSSPQFTVSPTKLALAPGANQNVAVTFSPTQLGQRSETLSIASNDPSKASIKITLKGNGVYPFDAGNVKVGSSSQWPITFGPYTTSHSINAGISGANSTDFSVAPSPTLDLPAGQRKSLTLTFWPRTAGDKSALLTLNFVPPGIDNPLKYNIYGVGIAAPSSQGLLTPRTGDGTAVLDLNAAAGDQGVRSLSSVKPGQKVDLQVFLNQEVAGATAVLVILMFDPQKLSVVSGKGDGVFVKAQFLTPVAAGSFATLGGAFLGSSVTAKGSVAALTFQASSGFSRDTEVTLTGLSVRGGAGKDFTPGASVVLSATGGGPPTPDFDGDGVVGFSDFFLFAAAFGQKATGDNAKFDLDGDGSIGFGDFFKFAENFGKKA